MINKKFYKIIFLLFLLIACNNDGNEKSKAKHEQNLLYDIDTFTSDSLVNVVIEIPAGSNEKWEVSKTTGKIEWEQVALDSFRTIDYLPYPANYGFLPQTILPESNGGDGDPIDVFVLGESIQRGSIVPCRIIGFIEMIDEGERDNKFIAIQVQSHWSKINSLEELKQHYPGVTDILRTWLANYKGAGKIQISDEFGRHQALDSIYKASIDFKYYNIIKRKNYD